MFELHILDHDSSVVEVMEFETLRQAERAESGVRINLDQLSHRYYEEVMSNFKLRILDLDDTVVEVMDFETFRQAERAESGVRINLDHANYHTDIVRK